MGGAESARKLEYSLLRGYTASSAERVLVDKCHLGKIDAMREQRQSCISVPSETFTDEDSRWPNLH